MSNRPALLTALRRLAPLLAVTALPHVRAQESAGPGRSTEKTEATTRSPPTFALAGGQAIVGSLAEKRLNVLTRYGELTVPFEEIVRVRFHPRLSREDTVRFTTLLTSLRKDPRNENVVKAITALGHGAYLLVSDARKVAEDKEIAAPLAEIQESFENVEGVYLDDRDEIVTKRFTIKGHILDKTLRIERGRLKLTIPISDIRHIAYGDLVIQRVFKVNSQHMEGSKGLLDTKLQVKKKQRFTLTPSGSMMWQGQAFGPAGISNHSWNSRNMGCLQWRIGKGPWKLLPSAFEGKADATGNIELCIHLTGVAPTGEFKVEFKMKKR